MNIELTDKLYTSTEVAEILGVSLRTLYRYMEDGKIASMKTASGRHRFTKDQILDFLNANSSNSVSTSSNSTPSNANAQYADRMQPNANVSYDPATGTQVSTTTSVPGFDVTSTPTSSRTTYGDVQSGDNVRQQDNIHTDVSQQTYDGVSSNIARVENTTFSTDETVAYNTQTSSTRADTVSSSGDVMGNLGNLDSTRQNVSTNTFAHSQDTSQKAQLNVDESEEDLLSEWVRDVSADEFVNSERTVQQKPSNVSGGVDAFNDAFSPSSKSDFEPQSQKTEVASATSTQRQEDVVRPWQDSGVSSSQVVQQERMPNTNVQAQVGRQFNDVVSTPDTKPVQENVKVEGEVKPGRIRFYKSEYTDLIALAKKIKEVAQVRDLEYAFTLDAGLSLHFGIRPFTILHFYVNPEDMNIWVNELRLSPASSSKEANIGILINTDIIFVPSKEIGGFRVVEDKILLNELAEFNENDLLAQFRQYLSNKS